MRRRGGGRCGWGEGGQAKKNALKFIDGHTHCAEKRKEVWEFYLPNDFEPTCESFLNHIRTRTLTTPTIDHRVQVV